MSRLQELRDRRAYECRLTPDRALRTLDEAEAFLRDRGLLTRTADSALPSLYEACHEGPYAPGRGGFGEWPATKWPWFGELADRNGIHRLKVHHRGKNLLVTEEVAAILDPICRSEIKRMREAPEWARVLDHLAAAGPSEPEDPEVPRNFSSQRCGRRSSRPSGRSHAGSPGAGCSRPSSSKASSPQGGWSGRSRAGSQLLERERLSRQRGDDL